jgi:hypothetical protein
MVAKGCPEQLLGTLPWLGQWGLTYRGLFLVSDGPPFRLLLMLGLARSPVCERITCKHMMQPQPILVYAGIPNREKRNFSSTEDGSRISVS